MTDSRQYCWCFGESAHLCEECGGPVEACYSPACRRCMDRIIASIDSDPELKALREAAVARVMEQQERARRENRRVPAMERR